MSGGRRIRWHKLINWFEYLFHSTFKILKSWKSSFLRGDLKTNFIPLNLFLMLTTCICWHASASTSFLSLVTNITRSSLPEVFLQKKCSEIMQQIYRRIPMLKCDLTWVKFHVKCDCKATWLKSYFDMSIPQYIYGIFAGQLFLRTHLERCFCIIQSWGLDAYLGPCQISVMQFFCESSKSLKARHTFVSAKSMIN